MYRASETLHLQNIQFPSAASLSHTITTLALVEMPQTWATLNLAFFTLPNLQILMLGGNGSSTLEEDLPSEQVLRIRDFPLVTTKLTTFVLAPFDFPAWLFTRLRETCHGLRTILFMDSEDFPAVSLEGPILNHLTHHRLNSSFLVPDFLDDDGYYGYLESFFSGKEGVHFICCPDLRSFAFEDRVRLERCDVWPSSVNILVKVNTILDSGDRLIHMHTYVNVEQEISFQTEPSEFWMLFRVGEPSGDSEGWEYMVSNIAHRYGHVVDIDSLSE